MLIHSYGILWRADAERVEGARMARESHSFQARPTARKLGSKPSTRFSIAIKIAIIASIPPIACLSHSLQILGKSL
jgi:hypothetical protein